MRTSTQYSTAVTSKQSLARGRYIAKRGIGKASLLTAFFIAICSAILSLSALRAAPQDVEEATSGPQDIQEGKATGKVIGLKNVCVHVLKLEKTLKLYREILGFKLSDAVILRGEGLEGMLVLELQAKDCKIHLSLPAPEHSGTIGPIGNTNHNHFMLLVDDIVPICEKLKKEGYALENEAYARDKYSFFTGPNGEIVGLTEYK